MKLVSLKVMLPLLMLNTILLYLKLKNDYPESLSFLPFHQDNDYEEEDEDPDNMRLSIRNRDLFRVQLYTEYPVELDDELDDNFEVEGWERNVERKIQKYIDFQQVSSIEEPELEDQVTYDKPHHLLYVIHSSPENTKLRNAIRTYHGYDCKSKTYCDYIFILGLTKSETFSQIRTEAEVSEESRLNRDILREDFIDSYQNLTLKSIYMLKYFVKKTEHFTHLLKLDDDTFANIFALDRILRATRKEKKFNFILGLLHSKVVPLRLQSRVGGEFEKWLAPKYIYPHDMYPTYTGGPGYLMTRSAAQCLLKEIAEKDMEIFHLEDIFLTGIVAENCLETEKLNYPGFEVLRPQSFWNSFEPETMIVLHLVNPLDNFGNVWKVLNRFLASKENSRKSFQP